LRFEVGFDGEETGEIIIEEVKLPARKYIKTRIDEIDKL
jgi:hypothetical protein